MRVKTTESKDKLVQETAMYLDSVGWPERLQVREDTTFQYVYTMIQMVFRGISWLFYLHLKQMTMYNHIAE